MDILRPGDKCCQIGWLREEIVKFRTGRAAEAAEAANPPESEFKPLEKSASLVLFTQSRFLSRKRGPLSLTDRRKIYPAFSRLSIIADTDYTSFRVNKSQMIWM
jgi:hypothetical protein